MLYLKGEKVCTCGFAEILSPQICEFAEICGLPIWLLYGLFYVKTSLKSYPLGFVAYELRGI